MRNVLVTGYRAHELNIFDDKHPGIAYIRQAVSTRLIALLEEGLEWMVTPGQYGVDLWACEAAFELRAEYPQLKVSIIAACADQGSNWSETKQAYYRTITDRVDYYAAVSNQPYQGGWQLAARDELLLRKTGGIILVYDEEAGEGSPRHIKNKALRKGAREDYRFMPIRLEDIQLLADEAAWNASQI
ncbi:DUF1273 domain-containing protein [Paenibacillus sp. IB182496]|uniref:DUF1273 domain-containing protein n=1 Tax=Paenibacillus sabuli TaxID=2772509 RepID=A0A927GR82_9BACL|nr:DUF1273 domain-containing protein [Paenibacillus sabuli]MBD2845026.1 DUF1273 domain-containing protein [Paenibacillus sabuli]